MAANYEIKFEKVLGRGGFATVYQGIIKNSGSPCAIKVIHQAALDNKVLEMAEKEIKVLKTLHHISIPSYYDTFRIAQDICIVQQIIIGESMQTLLGRLSSEDVIRFVMRISSVLSFVHANNIVHLDIKPANIYFSTDNNIFLLDFGIAKLMEATTATIGNSAMTRVYAAPEYLRGDYADGNMDRGDLIKCDIWSFGATILEAICGVRLLVDQFTDNYSYEINMLKNGTDKKMKKGAGETVIQWSLNWLLERRFADIPAARALWEAAPDDLRYLVALCLTHDFNDRPTMRDLIDDARVRHLIQKAQSLKAAGGVLVGSSGGACDSSQSDPTTVVPVGGGSGNSVTGKLFIAAAGFDTASVPPAPLVSYTRVRLQ